MDVPARFHFTHRRLVEFADTDLAGIMHFANFFRFVECAEHAFFRSLGHRVHTADGSAHQGWPRIEVACRYHKPARFEQTLEIGLRIQEVRTSSLSYGFWITVADDPARTLLATGAFSIIHVEIDTSAHTIRKAPISAPLRDRLQAFLTADNADGADRSQSTPPLSAPPA
jgi:YbgC/YbaW family acyl-CoA thioester hydrolase